VSYNVNCHKITEPYHIVFFLAIAELLNLLLRWDGWWTWAREYLV